MRRACRPGPAVRALLMAVAVVAAGRVEAGPPVRDTSRPAAVPASGVGAPANPRAGAPSEATVEPENGGAVREGIAPRQPVLSGHLRGSHAKSKPARPPAPPAKKPRTVPEPASILLLVSGLIGLAARRHLLRNRT